MIATFSSALLFYLRDEPGFGIQIQIRQETLDRIDCHRLVKLASHAGGFAGMVADPSADSGQGVFFLDKLQGFPVFALSSQSHVPLDRNVSGAGRFTWRSAALFDRKGARYGLGVPAECRAALVQTPYRIRSCARPDRLWRIRRSRCIWRCL